MRNKIFYFINAITVYRIIAAPILIFLVYNDNFNIFKWLLPISFFTDLIDGYLARKFNATSEIGASLDSIADDLTFVAAIIGMYSFEGEFMSKNFWTVIILISLFFIQTVLALLKYRKISSFHTYMAKLAALFQGSFLILTFLLPEPNYFLFYSAAIITILDLLEEIILVILLPNWQTNVKGLYWVLKKIKSPVKNRNF